MIQLAHADTYVGYGSTNHAGGTNCIAAQCQSNNAVTTGMGNALQNPFASTAQVTALGVFIGSQAPDKLVVLTSSETLNTFFTSYSGCGATNCAFLASGHSLTVVDVETISGLTLNGFNTIALAGPASVTGNQWMAATFMRTGGVCPNTSGNGCFQYVDTGGTSTVGDICFDFGTTSPSGSYSNSRSGNCAQAAAIVVGATFSGSQGGQTVTVTQCYGNCGSPAITLANTNSTHSVNFNQTISLFYEFQSNLNGFVKNVTTNVAKSYPLGIEFMGLSLYTIASCPLGQTPFSQACPGFLVAQLPAGANNPLNKGRVSLSLSGIQVFNGQWVGISVWATVAGLDLNDTNTNVNLFQTGEGKGAPVIQAATSLGASKMGLWAWITGNVVSGSPPTPAGAGCQTFSTIDCWLPALVNGFCSTATPSCQTSSAIFWIMILAIISEVALAIGMANATPNIKFPLGETFMLLLLLWTFAMTGLSLLVLWVPVFLFFIVSIMFSKHTGRFF